MTLHSKLKRESKTISASHRRWPITGNGHLLPKHLQAEMDRMAQHTRQSEVLRELFEALGNDPLVIAECLARPILAERLFKSALASQDPSWAVRHRIDSRTTQVVSSSGYTLPAITTLLSSEGTCIDAWAGLTRSNAPSGRYGHTTLWTGSEMIVWSGFDGQITFFNTGGRYSPSTDTWVATNITSAPSERGFHTAVWTGSEMIVWGVSIAVATWIPAGDIIPASTAGSPPAPATSQLRELDTRQLLSEQ